MTLNNDIELNSELQAMRASVSIDARDLDRRRADWAGMADLMKPGISTRGRLYT